MERASGDVGSAWPELLSKECLRASSQIRTGAGKWRKGEREKEREGGKRKSERERERERGREGELGVASTGNSCMATIGEHGLRPRFPEHTLIECPVGGWWIRAMARIGEQRRFPRCSVQ